MSLEEFCAIVFPPKSPFESGKDEDWAKVELEIGIKLPDDFKKFIEVYGTGKLGDFFYVLNPFAANKYVNLFEQIKVRLDANRMMQKQFPRSVPFPLYPEPDGILPWAFTDNGDVLFWLTKGEPDEWIVVVQESRLAEWEQFPESMSDFLTNLFKGKLSSRILGDDQEQESVAFKSLEEKS